ncbi:MAG: hypothetical protein M1536_05125, partial [Firmicutes bacterium]|nr:hypothetical protein [Bacillota bacterium]
MKDKTIFIPVAMIFAVAVVLLFLSTRKLALTPSMQSTPAAALAEKPITASLTESPHSQGKQTPPANIQEEAPFSSAAEAPKEGNYLVMSCDLSFEDGAQPELFKEKGENPQIYEFKNLRISVTINGKTKE